VPFVIDLHYVKPLAEIDLAREEHLEVLERHARRGTIVFSGAKSPRTGGIIVCGDVERAAVDAVIEDDPFHRLGLAEYTVTPLRVTAPGAERFGAWIAAYERAWRTAGTAPLRELFTEDAVYRAGPFDEPVAGRAAIGEFWEAEREGPDETFSLQWEIVTADGDTAVARTEVVYGDPPRRTYRSLWVITLTPDGRCPAFEEWPFHPGQQLAAP
jgi:uncharacterized protein YciI/ketosteroid isomerase-like protein